MENFEEINNQRRRGVRVRGGGRGGQEGRGQGGGGVGGQGGGRGWEGQGEEGGGGGESRRRMVISNEIQATVVDHVLNHGLSMREAGQSVQPNLSRFTVAAIIRTSGVSTLGARGALPHQIQMALWCRKLNTSVLCCKIYLIWFNMQSSSIVNVCVWIN